MKSHLITSSLITMFILLSPTTPGGEKEKLKLNIQGMHCASCVSMVKKTVRKISAIESVSVNLQAGTVEVCCDSASSRRSEVIETIERMGYAKDGAFNPPTLRHAVVPCFVPAISIPRPTKTFANSIMQSRSSRVMWGR